MRAATEVLTLATAVMLGMVAGWVTMAWWVG